MRLASAVCALLISSVAVAQTTPLQSFLALPWSLGISLVQWINKDEQKVLYVEVIAEGDGFEQAKLSAFRMAVERSVGTVIASETETRDSRIHRDEIISYASGYVTDYRLVDQIQRGNRTWIKMQVWVRHSAIANRLLGRAENTQTLDGRRLAEQVNSLNYERDQGNRLLATVMADYPHRAYIIENQTIETRYNNRRPEIVVEFDLRFNRVYLYSLYETLKNIAQSADPGNCHVNCRTPFGVHIQGRNDGIFFTRWEWSFGFTESDKVDLMYDAMIASRPGLLVQIKDASGYPIHSECFFWAEIDGQVQHRYPDRPFVRVSPDRRISILGNTQHRGTLHLQNLLDVSRANTVQIEMVRGSKCPG